MISEKLPAIQSHRVVHIVLLQDYPPISPYIAGNHNNKVPAISNEKHSSHKQEKCHPIQPVFSADGSG